MACYGARQCEGIEMADDDRCCGRWKLWVGQHWLDCLFLVSLVFTLTTAWFFGAAGRLKEMWTAIGAGLLCMAFTRLDRLSEFSGLGFHAKLRKMEAAEEAAWASVDAVKAISKAIVSASLEGLVNSSTAEWECQENVRIRNNLYRSLCDDIGIDSAEADLVVAPFNAHVLVMHAENLIDAADKQHTLSEEAVDRASRDLIRCGDWYTGPVESFRMFLRDNDVSEVDEVKEAMVDMEYYRKNNELRRPEMWRRPE